MSQQQRLSATQFAVGAAVVATAYVLFHHLNAFLFSRIEVSDQVNWVFLPAAIRMVAVMLLGWAGVAGLYLGSLSLLGPVLEVDPARALIVAGISSVPCLLAAQVVRRVQRVSSDLAGLTGRQLIIFGLAGGLASSGAHTVYFAATASSMAPFADFFPMFVGDTLGTFFMLYGAVFVLNRFSARAVKG